MTVAMLLGYDTIRPDNTLDAIVQRYTCPNDGYVRAWPDSVDQTLVWLLPTCPVDAVEAQLRAKIADFVTGRYNGSDTMSDAYQRVQDIIVRVQQDASIWLNEHATPSVSSFLSDTTRMHALIVQELKNQGIVA